MERGGGRHNVVHPWPWPSVIWNTANQMLILLRYFAGSCNFCGGPLADKLGYYCGANNFNFHCECVNQFTPIAMPAGVQAQTHAAGGTGGAGGATFPPRGGGSHNLPFPHLAYGFAGAGTYPPQPHYGYGHQLRAAPPPYASYPQQYGYGFGGGGYTQIPAAPAPAPAYGGPYYPYQAYGYNFGPPAAGTSLSASVITAAASEVVRHFLRTFFEDGWDWSI